MNPVSFGSLRHARHLRLDQLFKPQNFRSFKFYSTEERITDEMDVLIIGGGPAGLATAIRLKQLAAEKSKDIRVVLLEKGPEIGKYSF